jgi:hypothetical protein
VYGTWKRLEERRRRIIQMSIEICCTGNGIRR